MAFTASDVKNLREATGCGMMDCKKALTQADGDFDKAVEILREMGLAKAAKKAGRIAAEGIVYATVDKAAKIGVVVEVNSETDFVAKNETFKNFVSDVATVIARENPADVADLLTKTMPSGKTVDEALKENIQVIGENQTIRRFVRYEGDCVSYIHAGGTHGVLVKFETSDEIYAKPEFEAYGRNVAMQIAAMNPGYLDRESVPQSVIDNETAILVAQMENDPKNASKPQAIKEKIAAGQIGKFFKENCLVEQAYVQDGDMTVKSYTDSVAKALGGDIKIVAFTRYEKGEGVEKKRDDFAAEVASMVK